MIIDSLTFLGESIFGHHATAGDLLMRMDEAGIDRAVVCPMKPRNYHLAAANNTVAEAVRTHKDRLIGLARVDPLLGDEAFIEIERALSELRLAGLFLHPWEETFRINAPCVHKLMEAVRRHQVPVMVATGYPWVSEALQVGELIKQFAEVPFILTNGGQLNISGLGQIDAQLALSENHNSLVQTAGVYREDFIEGVVEQLGADRVLFASAFPLMDPRLEILRVRWSHVGEADKQQMLGGNAARLFGV